MAYVNRSDGEILLAWEKALRADRGRDDNPLFRAYAALVLREMLLEAQHYGHCAPNPFELLVYMLRDTAEREGRDPLDYLT